MTRRAFLDSEWLRSSTLLTAGSLQRRRRARSHYGSSRPATTKERCLLNVLSTWTRLPTPFLSCLLLPLNYFACVDNCRTRRLGLLHKINPARFTSRVVFLLAFFQFARPEKQSEISNHRSIVHTACLTAVAPRRKVGITLALHGCMRKHSLHTCACKPVCAWINWAESNAFWIMPCIWRGNGTVDEGLRSANIRSEFNLAPNDQGHYGCTPEEAEAHGRCLCLGPAG